jgi:hypothetical protein
MKECNEISNELTYDSMTDEYKEIYQYFVINRID